MAIDSTVVHRAIDLAEPGDILVIDRTGDTKHACWGEMTSLAAKVRGLAATIVDGPATDVVEIEEMEYLVFSRGVSPITTRSLAQFGEINTVVQCGGVPVSPATLSWPTTMESWCCRQRRSRNSSNIASRWLSGSRQRVSGWVPASRFPSYRGRRKRSMRSSPLRRRADLELDRAVVVMLGHQG